MPLNNSCLKVNHSFSLWGVKGRENQSPTPPYVPVSPSGSALSSTLGDLYFILFSESNMVSFLIRQKTNFFVHYGRAWNFEGR
jgi:hypothetical protein